MSQKKQKKGFKTHFLMRFLGALAPKFRFLADFNTPFKSKSAPARSAGAPSRYFKKFKKFPGRRQNHFLKFYEKIRWRIFNFP